MACLSERSELRELLMKVAEKQKITTTIPTVPIPVETKETKSKLKQFAKDPLDDTECFAVLIQLVEAIGNRDSINARAAAWATGDLKTLERIPALPNPEV